MALRQVTDTTPVRPAIERAPLAQLTPCDENALEQLIADFESRKLASVVFGPGRARTRKVIDTFLSSRSEQTCRVRLSDPCRDAEACLKSIVEGIGFGTDGLNERELDGILRMFLAVQRTHRRRTVICVDNAEQCDEMALGKIFELIDIEAEEDFGLFVVLAGHEALDRRMKLGVCRAIAAYTGQAIPVSPLAMAETRDLVLDRIGAQDFDDATIVIEPEAIARMHELSGGICDTVNGLCEKCLELAASETIYPITSGLIDRAAVELGILHAEIVAVPQEFVTNSRGDLGVGKLKLYCRGRKFCDYSLDRDVIRIGRHRRNDVSLPSPLVSRYHALLTISEGGVTIVDLGSSNGTTVNGNYVKARVLTYGDTIGIGDYRGEYVVSDEAANAIVAAEIMALDQPVESGEPGLPLVRVRRA